MVLINRCCCWKSLRRGSFASGIFTLVRYIILFTTSVFNVYYVAENADLLTFGIFMLTFSFFSVVTSVILLIGLCVDNRLLLLPWIGAISFSTLLDFGLCVYLIPDVMEKPSVGIFFVTDLIFCALNIYCLTCVVSQYQEYLAGRGRAGQTANSQMIPTVRFQPSYGPTQTKNIPSVSFQVAQNGHYSSGLLMVPSPNSSSLSKSPRPTDLSSISEEQTSSNEISRKMSTDDTSANDDETSYTRSPSLRISRKKQDGASSQLLEIHRDKALSKPSSNSLAPCSPSVKHINVQIVISDTQENSLSNDELRDIGENTLSERGARERC